MRNYFKTHVRTSCIQWSHQKRRIFPSLYIIPWCSTPAPSPTKIKGNAAINTNIALSHSLLHSFWASIPFYIVFLNNSQLSAHSEGQSESYKHYLSPRFLQLLLLQYVHLQSDTRVQQAAAAQGVWPHPTPHRERRVEIQDPVCQDSEKFTTHHTEIATATALQPAEPHHSTSMGSAIGNAKATFVLRQFLLDVDLNPSVSSGLIEWWDKMGKNNCHRLGPRIPWKTGVIFQMRLYHLR